MDVILVWGLVGLVQAFICGGLSTNLAEKKGYGTGAWFAAGFLFGIFGLIAAAGLPPSRLQAETDAREYEKQARRQVVEEALGTQRKKRTATVDELLDDKPAQRERNG